MKALRYIITVVGCLYVCGAFGQCCEFSLIKKDTVVNNGIFVIEKPGYRAKIIFEIIPPLIYEQFQTTGTWTYATNTTDPFKSKDVWYSNQVGATLIVNVYGRKFEIVTATASHHGQVGVSLNNGPEVIVNLYSATRVNEKIVYESAMPFGTNSIKIRVVGGGYGVIDYIRAVQ